MRIFFFFFFWRLPPSHRRRIRWLTHVPGRTHVRKLSLNLLDDEGDIHRQIIGILTKDSTSTCRSSSTGHLWSIPKCLVVRTLYQKICDFLGVFPSRLACLFGGARLEKGVHGLALEGRKPWCSPHSSPHLHHLHSPHTVHNGTICCSRVPFRPSVPATLGVLVVQLR